MVQGMLCIQSTFEAFSDLLQAVGLILSLLFLYSVMSLAVALHSCGASIAFPGESVVSNNFCNTFPVAMLLIARNGLVHGLCD